MPNIQLRKEQKEIADQLQFKMESHLNMRNAGYLQHGCVYKDMKITRVVTTPKRKGVWGEGKQTFYIDKEKTEYDVIGLLNELIKRTLKVNG